jgi:hypothetical protein
VELIQQLQEQAAEREWLAGYAAMHADRDRHIRRAAQLGIEPGEIARLLRLSRKHVVYIISQGVLG